MKKFVLNVNIEENEDYSKLIKFGAGKIKDLKNLPPLQHLQNGVFFAHRDLDIFIKAIEKGEKVSLISGFNPSSTMHLGHLLVFQTILDFQKHYKIPMLLVLSDDESYVAGKVDSFETALKNALALTKQIFALGFDPKLTKVMINQLYPKIYTLAFKLSRAHTLSSIKAIFGFDDSTNHGLAFYPAVQDAHILAPQEYFGAKYVLVPVGPDQDVHLRACRDAAEKYGYTKPASIYPIYIEGLDGKKMSKTNPDAAIFLKDKPEEIKRKIMKAVTGGACASKKAVDAKGGDPHNCNVCKYLFIFFEKELAESEIKNLCSKGCAREGGCKELLIQKTTKFLEEFEKREKEADKILDKVILKM